MKEGNKIGKILIIGITLVLLTLSLSGCDGPNPLDIDTGPSQVVGPVMPDKEEEEKFIIMPDGVKVTGDIDKIKILDYEVYTELWHSMSGWYKFTDGFVIPSENDYNMYTIQPMRKYVISGTAQNIAGETIATVSIGANFYDSNGNPLTGACWWPKDSTDHKMDESIFEFTISIERPDPRSGKDLSVFDSIADFSIDVKVWDD